MAANDVNIRLRAKDETAGAFRSVKGSLGGLKSAVFSVQGAIAGIVGGAVVGTIVNANRSFQSLQASLITFTGSAEAAAAQFEVLQKFASTTPFALEEVVGGFNKLIARGINPSIESLTAFGNIASGTGKSLDMFIEAVADAAVGEFERLKEFGIKAKSEGDKVSLTFGGVTKTIGKNSQEMLAYLEQLGQTKFAGSIERQANTIGGAFSNFGDAISTLSVAIGEAGLNDFLVRTTREMSRLIDVTTQATKANLDLIDVIGITLREAFNGATESLKVYREDLNTLKKGRSILDFLGLDLTNSNKEIDDLQKKINILMMSERTSARGMGFTDPRIIKSPVKALPAPLATEAIKSLGTYEDRIKDMVAGAVTNSAIVKAKELGEAVKALNKLALESGLDFEIYESAMASLIGSYDGVTQSANAVKAAVDSAISNNALTRGNQMLKQIEELDKRFFDGIVNAQQYDAAMIQLTGSTAKFGDAVKEVKHPLKEFADSMPTLNQSIESVVVGGIKSLEDSLVGLVQGTMSASQAFKSMASSIINDLIRMAIQQSITAPLAQMFGLQAAAPSVSLAGKAIGGSVQSGRPYMVGERGAEMFVPNQSGSIIPSNQMGGGGGTIINQVINVTTGVQQTVRAEIMTLMPQIANAAKSAVAEAKLRGGSYAAALG
tara:strand:+ start:1046 stop:3037 length:1992 start_codon:yes stop_codon:yes gene_type:complete